MVDFYRFHRCLNIRFLIGIALSISIFETIFENRVLAIGSIESPLVGNYINWENKNQKGDGNSDRSPSSETFQLPRKLAQGNRQPQPKPSFWSRRPRRPLTIRGVICPISPGLIDNLAVWHDRPLFIWQGQGSQIRVRDYNQRDKTLWSQSLTQQEPQRYSGQTPLQHGQLYQWQVMTADSEAPRPTQRRAWETFRMVSADQYQAISTALGTLEQKLQQQNASAEAIALSKAEFFADQELWSDALQVIYEVKNPSAQFVEQRSAYIVSLCQAFTP